MKLLKTAVIGASLALGSIAAPVLAADVTAPSGAYKVDPTHASVTWKISHLGLSVYNARFTKFDIDLNLDVDDVSKSSVKAVIDVTSVETDYPGETDFNGEIANDPKFLNSSAFPKIEFVSKSVEKTGEKTAKIHGTVTMLGVSKDMTLDATLIGATASHPFSKAPAVGFNATGTLKRSEFGFTHLVPYIGDEVTFNIDAEFQKAK